MKGLSYPFCTVFPVDETFCSHRACGTTVTGCFPTLNYQKVCLVEGGAGTKKEKVKTFLYEPFAISSLTTGGNNS